ncbi:MAG: hypothetical protein FWC11_06170, partial [Firmicutes bacterium]|nr:hypothetical protein [Bacillota bacterium]
HSYFKPLDSANGAFNEGIMEFVVSDIQPCVYLYAVVGNEDIFEAEVPRLDKTKKLIEESELRYGVNKTHGNGALGASTERMLNSVMWSRIYYPYLMKDIFSPHRTNLNKHFDIKGVDENCSAILGTYAEIGKVKDQLMYTVQDKILAPLSLWHTFCHAEDKLELMKLYKALSKLYPPDSNFITTTDETKNEVAYKWNDSPLKELKNGNGIDYPMYSLDLTCLKLLAFDIIERILSYYDASEKAKYKKAKTELIAVINKIFYNEEEGLYMNRYVTGDWAESVGATSFYPLIAGAVNCPKKLEKLIGNLKNPKKFWTNYIIPTLSASHLEFGKKGKMSNNALRNPPYFEYRGSIIPYVNYLVYQGLVRYGLDETAGEFALKCARLWSNNVTHNVENYSMYLPTGKRYKKSIDHLSSNGNMLALIGMQEIIDIEYFGDGRPNSIRFGTFVMGTNSITNLKLLGKTYSIDINDELTILIIDEKTTIRGGGGKFKVRNFLLNQNGCEFVVTAKQNITFNINIASKKESTKYYFIVPTGKSKVVAQNGMVKIEEIGD